MSDLREMVYKYDRRNGKLGGCVGQRFDTLPLCDPVHVDARLGHAVKIKSYTDHCVSKGRCVQGLNFLDLKSWNYNLIGNDAKRQNLSN